MRQVRGLSVTLLLAVFATGCAHNTNRALPRSGEPELKGFCQLATDDCGRVGLQPHIVSAQGDYEYPFESVPESAAPRGGFLRTVSHGEKVQCRFTGLLPKARYKIAVDYLSDAIRVQSLSVDGTVLQDKLRIEKAAPVRSILDIPDDIARDGEITLEWTRVEGPNAVVSRVQLWSDVPALKAELRFALEGDLKGNLKGKVFDVNNARPMPRTRMSLDRAGQGTLSARTDKNGEFLLAVPESWRHAPGDPMVTIRAKRGKMLSERHEMLGDLLLDPPRYAPVPEGYAFSLNGKWRFNPTPADGFESTGIATDTWPEIAVPGEWTMQGFEVRPESQAAYRTSFDVPAAWADRCVYLRFGAVFSDAVVWVNGVEAGRHEGGFTQFDLDVTRLVKPGANTLALGVKSASIADTLASASQYAAHPLGGILRDVTLFSVPQIHIASVRVTTTPAENGAWKAEFDVQTANFGHASKGEVKMDAEILAPGENTGKSIQTVFETPKSNGIVSTKGWITLPDAKTWDAEHPVMYTVNITLTTPGQDETIRIPFGFREVKVSGNEVLVNGKPVKLRGVCRHEAHRTLGRAITDELRRKDVEVFREANVNYIRTSHYPPGEGLTTAADELGMFVEQEAPLCWVGHPANSIWGQWNPRDERYRTLILRQTLEMIARDANHPSVIIWSLANESTWTSNFERSNELAKAFDPTRPTSFHDQAWGGYNNAHSKADIAVYHYPTPEQAAKPDEAGRPMLFGEYCHLNAYNRRELETDPGVRDEWGRALAPMWDSMYAAKGCLGGALWSGIDDIFDLPGGRQAGYGAWGVIDQWRRPKPEWLHVQNSYAPVRVLQKTIPKPAEGQPLVIQVENRHDFMNLSEMEMVCCPEGSEAVEVKADIPPHSIGELRIDAKIAAGSRFATLGFEDPRGFMGLQECVMFGDPTRPASVAELVKEEVDKVLAEARTGMASARPVMLAEQADAFVATTPSGLAISIGKKDGRIAMSYGKGNESVPVLVGGPSLMLIPAMAEPCAPEHRGDVAPLNDVCANWTATSVSAMREGLSVLFRIVGKYDEAEGEFTLRILPGNEVEVAYSFGILREVTPRQTGVQFVAHARFSSMACLRHPQWSSQYMGDHIGAPMCIATAESDTQDDPPGSGAWEADAHPMGTAGFRSTRTNAIYSGLFDQEKILDPGANAFVAILDGKHATRAFLENGNVGFLVANYSNAGSEPFVSSHFKAEKITLKPGDRVSDRFTLLFVK